MTFEPTGVTVRPAVCFQQRFIPQQIQVGRRERVLLGDSGPAGDPAPPVTRTITLPGQVAST